MILCHKMVEYKQNSPYDSPWPLKVRVKTLLWEYSWNLLCTWTPKPMNTWRLFWLKIFGATIYGKPFVHQRAIIQMPWNLTLHHRACLGDRSNAYSLGKIEIGAHATVAQEAYLCTGTHAFNSSSMNLITKSIFVGDHAFIGLRSIIMPGVRIGKEAIVGAGSIVTKDVNDYEVVAGNPAKAITKRKYESKSYP